MFAKLGTYVYMMMFVLVGAYIVARWRDHRESKSDPQLGIKVAICAFRVFIFQVALLSLGAIIYSWVSTQSEEVTEWVFRRGAGALAPAVLVLGLYEFVLRRTNFRERPMVSHMFDGLNFVQSALIATASAFYVGHLIFEPGASADQDRLATVFIIIYSVTAAVQGWGLLRQDASAQLPRDP